jgi:hypothetical protein
MYEYYEQFQKHAGNTDVQKRWANQLTWEIARHAVGEEIIVYPLMEALLGQEGKALADQDREDHQVCIEVHAIFHLMMLTVPLQPSVSQDNARTA